MSGQSAEPDALEREALKVLVKSAVKSALEDYPGYIESGRRAWSDWVADRVNDVIFKEPGEEPAAPFSTPWWLAGGQETR